MKPDDNNPAEVNVYRLGLLLNILDKMVQNEAFACFVKHWNTWRSCNGEKPNPYDTLYKLAYGSGVFTPICRTAVLAAAQYLYGEGIPDQVLHNITVQIRDGLMAVARVPECLYCIVDTATDVAMLFRVESDFYIWVEGFLKNQITYDVFADMKHHAKFMFIVCWLLQQGF